MVIVLVSENINMKLNSSQSAFIPQAVGFSLARLGDLLGINEMSGSPVTLDEPPGPRHVDRVPRVPEPVIFELDSGLVTSGLAVTFDNHTVESSKTRIEMFTFSYIKTEINTCIVS